MMTRRESREYIEQLAMRYPCVTCGALPGRWCTIRLFDGGRLVPGGVREAGRLHRPRVAPVRQAWEAGFAVCEEIWTAP